MITYNLITKNWWITIKLTEKIKKRNRLRLKLLILLKEKPRTRDDICKELNFTKSNKIYPKYKQTTGNNPTKTHYTKKQYIDIYEKRSTIYDNLEALLKANLIKKEKIPSNTKGRPKTLWSIK